MEWLERIARLRSQIQRDTQELADLEEQYQRYGKQLEMRQKYMSSREIIELITAYQGISKNMTAIKRWADEGLLGESIEEREHFPLLVKKQGNKRFLYLRSTVVAFLTAKQYIFPRFEVVDLVKWNRQSDAAPQHAVIIASQLHDSQFGYTIQLEDTGEFVYEVWEHELELVEEDA